MSELGQGRVETFTGNTTDPCTVLHVDMDAFFAAVEVFDDPSLAGKPVIVGGSGARGVVASCTYEARAYGIHSAMPSVVARRLCPHAVFVAGRYDRYSETSERLHDILLRFTPMIEGIGLDEAFLDVAGALRLFGSPRTIATSIRDMVHEELHLDCCVGVARTKLLAKLASRAAKPVATMAKVQPGPGVLVVRPEEEISFLHPLPIRALWGVGPATGKRLAGLGVVTVGDLAKIPDETLQRAVGAANGRHLAALAKGEDDRGVEPSRRAKSVGHEETFAKDLRTHEDLHRQMLRMSDAVAARLREAGLWGRTITLKVRYGDRRTITRSQTLPRPHDSAHVVAAVAGALLDATELSTGVRLLGVSVSSLTRRTERARQLSFDAADGCSAGREGAGTQGALTPSPGGSARESAWDEVAEAVSQIRARYGQSAVAAAALVGPEGISVKRRGDTQWGPSDSTRPGGQGHRRGGRSRADERTP
ncbi:MAG: DNA polymerase IV [Acidimicrobiales bacterium]